jgi:4-alpha-glucanotransferase
MFKRSSGILLHPTSFPSDFGIGDLGPEAVKFIDFLRKADLSVWQILPLGPTGYGNSPYASYSAFAGNHYLISPEILEDKGLLKASELRDAALPSNEKVDYDSAYANKRELFRLAASRFYERDNKEEQKALKAFKKQNAYWLDDYVLFIACLEHYGFRPWNTWDAALAKREPEALKKAKKEHRERIDYHYFLQFEFFSQWMKLREYANSKDIIIIGDIPIFVDHNSSDVWAHSRYFEVDGKGNRKLVAGVPPDYFSETGQLWGNPLYKWKVLKKDGYSWWLERFRQMFHLFDSIRVDHFRGFDAYWEVKADAENAIRGRWVKGPGEDLFDTILEKMGSLPIIAEDLGVITPEVVKLRDKYDFPGMKILQFAFSDNAGNSFLPHNYHTSNCVVYTGTHDNDTTQGWYRSATGKERHHAREYTRSDGSTIHAELIRTAMMSVAVMAIFPMQDLLGLGTEHRMNYPSTVSNNWEWRYRRGDLARIDLNWLRWLVQISNRDPRLNLTDANLTTLETEEAN